MSETPETWSLAGHTVEVTHVDTLYWPDERLTKGDLLAYYREVAPVMLPYLTDRPVTMRFYPAGIAGPSFYSRARPADAPDWLRSTDYQTETDGHILHALLIDAAAGLIWLANSGSIEFHTWSSRLPDLSEPDVAVFDLDPGDQAGFDDVRRAALLLREALERLELRGYPKTSGKHGLHIYVPLAPGQTFERVREWVKGLTEQLANAHPELIAVAHRGTHAGRRVTIDHAQNSIGRNTATPYTARAVPGAPVSAPLSWDEVEAGRPRPGDLSLRTMRARIAKIGDIFAPVLHGGQQLPG